MIKPQLQQGSNVHPARHSASISHTMSCVYNITYNFPLIPLSCRLAALCVSLVNTEAMT